MMHYIRILLAGLLLFVVICTIGQHTSATRIDEQQSSFVTHSDQFDLPMRIVPVLSSNFGELRNNHFHSGLDFKTNKETGIPVYAVADGWISRIRISAWGFGYALYLDHPNGFTSVYGHLDRYAYPFDSIAIAHQYHIEQFELDSMYEPGQIPVKRGQLIAYSGNSGSSSAPHLHFEIRDTKTEETIDPLIWYFNRIPDHKAPRIREITVFAIPHEGILKGNLQQHAVSAIQLKDSSWQLKDTLPAVWGKIGLGIKAYDYMDNAENIYGICKLTLYKEEDVLFTQELSRFSFADTRYINALIDFEAWQRKRTLTMRSYLLPGNHFPLCSGVSDGILTVDKESVTHYRYQLSDRYGNTTEIRFILKGERMDIPKAVKKGVTMKYQEANMFRDNDIELYIPPGSLYEDIDFEACQRTSVYYSDIFCLHDSYTPLHQSVPLKLRLTTDNLVSKKAYYLARENRYGNFQYVSAGTYQNGWLATTIREFGKYTVLADTMPPKITPVKIENAIKNRLFRIRITDDATGLSTWRGTIDGKWALFEYHTKTGQLRYAFDDNRLDKDRQHTLELHVFDACGNESTFQYMFYY